MFIAHCLVIYEVVSTHFSLRYVLVQLDSKALSLTSNHRQIALLIFV